ncbi:hypothetical protein LC609_15950 [Nostoc sp. XA013]|nr:hypothetical protein [Nostoc sp. XA013]
MNSAKYRQTQLAEAKLQQGDVLRQAATRLRLVAATMLQTAAKTAYLINKLPLMLLIPSLPRAKTTCE